MRTWSVAVVAVVAVRMAVGEMLPVANATFDEKDAKGKPVGWHLTNRMTVGRNAGHNGSGGLYWESETPVGKLSSAMQDVKGLRKGDTVRLEALVWHENLKYKGYGAQVTLELLDTNDHWIAALYSGSGTKEKDGEWYVRKASGVLPANFGRARLAIHVAENVSGAFAVDNVSVERVEAKPVQFVVSSAYRNTAAGGKVKFFASLETPPEAVGKTSAVFVWKNAAGETVRTPAASLADDAASVELDVGQFAPGAQSVGCDLSIGEKRIGEAAVRFTRVAELPTRRVTIDAHKRCLVDGKPFFPIGVYAYPSSQNLHALTNTPFNTVLHYQMPSKDLLVQFNRLGLKTFSAFDHKLPEDQLRKRIDEIKGDPAVLAWYLGDEYPTGKIPHLRKLYETVCELDPDHPAYLVQDRVYDLRGFLPTTDVIGLDPYPVPEKPVGSVTGFIRGGRKAFFDVTPQWSVPQAFSWAWYSRPKDRFPTEDELRSMLWQHIAAGANGIVSFRMHSTTSETWKVVLKTHREIAERTDVLLSVEDCPAAVSSDEGLSCRAWVKDGALHVLACNILEKPLEAGVTLSAGSWKAVSSALGPMPEVSAGRELRFRLPPMGVSFVRLEPQVGFGSCGPRSVLELPPGPGNPRNSEGDFAVQRDGSVLFAYTHYTKGNGGDNDPAGLYARVSHDGGRTWSAESKEIIPNDGGMNVMCASFLRLKDGALALFYLLKDSASDCRPVMRVSRDEGKSWSSAVKCLPDAERDYYVMENCRVERLSNGRIVLPLCRHETRAGKYDGHGKLVCWFSDDEGRTWRRGAEPFAAFDAAGNRLVLQEPGLVELKDGRVLMYARTCHGRQWSFTSSDHAETWSAGRPSPLMGPCSPATLKRLSNGDLVAVWNDHADYPEYAARDGGWGRRLPLSVAVSKDDGVTWIHRRTVSDERDGGWYCYFGVLEHKGNLLIGYCALDVLKHLRVTSVPLDWIYGGGDDGTPRRGFAGIREGAFWGLSTGTGVWSAKPGDAEIRAWNRGQGVHILGGENRRAYLELPVGTSLGSLRLYAERFTAEGGYALTVEGRVADGSWRRLCAQGSETQAGRLTPLALADPAGEVTALRFTCTSAKGVLITD